jgi:hypothetical protein
VGGDPRWAYKTVDEKDRYEKEQLESMRTYINSWKLTRGAKSVLSSLISTFRRDSNGYRGLFDPEDFDISWGEGGDFPLGKCITDECIKNRLERGIYQTYLDNKYL